MKKRLLRLRYHYRTLCNSMFGCVPRLCQRQVVWGHELDASNHEMSNRIEKLILLITFLFALVMNVRQRLLCSMAWWLFWPLLPLDWPQTNTRFEHPSKVPSACVHLSSSRSLDYPQNMYHTKEGTKPSFNGLFQSICLQHNLGAVT